MKKYVLAALPAALFAAFIPLLASCGSGTGGGESGDVDHGSTNHSNGGHAGMDVGRSAAVSGASVSPGGEYSDAAFVSAMVAHHQEAVEMAELALWSAEHEEMRGLAGEIVVARNGELRSLEDLLLEPPDASSSPAAPTEADGPEATGTTGAEELAGADPFDLAFVDAMTPHHESAIALSNVALEESENPEVRELARSIAEAHKHEGARMSRWQVEWYPQS